MEFLKYTHLLLALCYLGCTYGQPTPSCLDICSERGAVRLVGVLTTSQPAAGRVEICNGSCWGTICGDTLSLFWSTKNAHVACRSAGFVRGALNSMSRETVVRADDTVPIHFSSVACTGRESSLIDCPSSPVSESCTHDLDAAITCIQGENPEDYDIRLYGDQMDGVGIVEIYNLVRGIWIPVCTTDGTWDSVVAGIICRQLGYESGDIATYFQSPLSITSTRAQAFECLNNRRELSQCVYFQTTQCTSAELGGVRCTKSILPDKSIRLDGSAESNEGRVEILFNGRWGTMCNDGFSSTEARLACRTIGFADFDSLSVSGLMENDFKPVWYDDVDCASSETTFANCITRSPVGYGSCVTSSSSTSRADVRCDSSSGLSSGAIIGIVFGLLAVVFIGIPLMFVYGKQYWARRENYGWYRSARNYWNSFRNFFTPNQNRNATVSPSHPPPVIRAEPVQRRASSSESEAEPQVEPQAEPQAEPRPHVDELPESQLTRGAPPSYHSARRFPEPKPQPEPDEKPTIPEELPPPYPGAYPPPSAPPGAAAAAYPPTSYPPGPYPPPHADFQGYPPPTNPAYPSAVNPAYPPPTNPAYPPAAYPAYPPGGEVPFQSAPLPAEEFSSYPPGE